MPPQCLTLSHTRQHLVTKMHHKHSAQARGDGWGGREAEEERQRSASTHTVTVIGRKGGACPRPAPSTLRERPCSSRGGNTAGAKEDKIPAGLHTHSGAGGKAAQSRDLGIQRGRMQRCHGAALGCFWGLLWSRQPGPRGSSSDEADERAELSTELHGAGAAQEAPGSALLSDFSHHRQFQFKGAAALEPSARCNAARG